MQSVGGGFLGGGMILAARYGIARGLFSNESGLGSAPIVAASAQTPNAVHQAINESTPVRNNNALCRKGTIVIINTGLIRKEG